MSPEIPDNIEKRIESLAEEHDVDASELGEKVKTTFEEVQEADMFDRDAEKQWGTALRSIRSDMTEASNVPGTEVEILTIGHNGVQAWPKRDDDGNVITDSNGDAVRKDVMVAFGVIDPGEDKRHGIASIKLDSTDGVDIKNALELFEPLNVVKGSLNVDESDDLPSTYSLWSTSSTSLEEADAADMPEDLSKRREILHQFTDEVEISNIMDGLSATTRHDGQERTANFGADVKRIEANVVDYYLDRESGVANYTITDESIVDEVELEGNPVVDENQRTPGLTCWTSVHNMDYGTGTEGEFYGSIEKNDDDGRVTMQLYGVVPLYPRPLEEADDTDTETDSI